MDYITPQNTILFALFLISLSTLYKLLERKLLKDMHETPEAYQHIGKGFRYRYQQLYRDQSDIRHAHFFDDATIRMQLEQIQASTKKGEC
ncbi:hypothetical protein PVOR_01555 [Paenibacillus vortex V453]|uniref:Uncharacterized protein n=1 Tax=Paenibacillus vortex V453 TaxID=715225 RepID=A0A2R9T2M8_9BACL|nr:hypothetical protein [Paenibacillus vortex]EFU43856.1 hypothetical protein PVOR_01555 [Paenibacillus vortex V453]